MTLEHAELAALNKANETGSSVLVYRATHLPANIAPVYGIAFTLPVFAVRIGKRVYPSQDRPNV